MLTDQEFDNLCHAYGFGAVARNEVPLLPRSLLKSFVDAAVVDERERCAVIADGMDPLQDGAIGAAIRDA